MGSSHKIAKGVFWTTLVNIINGIYGFISVPILLYHFGKSDYGLIGLAMSINVYLRLMDMGLNSTNIRFFSNWISKEKYHKVNRLFQTSLSFYGTIGLINAIVLIIISCFSSSLFCLTAEQDLIIKHLFYILAISAFISWYTSCFDQLIKANEYVGWTQKVTLLPKMLQIIILGLTVYYNFSIELYYALTVFVLLLVIPFCIHKINIICPYISFRPSFDKGVFKEILPYCLNIFSFGIFQFSINYLRPVFLGMQGTIESVSDYRILQGIINIVVMLGGAFLGIILPSASKAVARKDKDALHRVAYDGTKYITISICLFCFGGISISHELLSVYVGADYLYLTKWLNVWLLCTLATHNQAISSLILSGSDIRAITYSTMSASIIGLGVCWFTIPYMEIGGTVIGYATYFVIQMLFYYLYYWPVKMKLDSVRIFTRSFFPYAFAGGIISLLCIYCPIGNNNWINLFVRGGLFVLLYSIVIFFILNKADKQFIYGLIKQKH